MPQGGLRQGGFQSGPRSRGTGLQRLPVGRVALYVHAILGLVLVCGTFRYLLASGVGTEKLARAHEGNLTFQLIAVLIYLPACVAVALRYSKAVILLRENWLLMLLIALPLLSATWSILPDTSLRRAVAMVLTVVFALHLVLRFDARELLRILAVAMLIFLAVSWLAVGMAPGLAITSGETTNIGAWRGLYGQKNGFGQGCALALILFFFLRLGLPEWRRIAVLAILLAGIALLMSQSRSSWLGAMAGVAAGYLVYRFLARQRFSLTVKSLALAVSVIAAFLGLILVADLLLAAIGRDWTFSNRFLIWEAAIAEGLKHPWLGAGYGAFWSEARIANVAYFTYIDIQNGHSGYLDLWLELGFVGLGLFLACCLVVLVRLGRLVMQGRKPDLASGFLFAVLITLLVFSFSEKVLMVHSNINWVLFLLAAFYASPSLNRAVSNRLPAERPRPTVPARPRLVVAAPGPGPGPASGRPAA